MKKEDTNKKNDTEKKSYNSLNKSCPSCGANIIWDVDKSGFYCKYCNSIFSIEEVDKTVKEVKTHLEKDFKKISNDDNLSCFKCESCGAEIICDDTITATKCVFCGNNVILSKKIESGIMPNYIIPFSKNKDYVYEEFKRKGKKKILVSKKFKDIKNIKEIYGVYVPYWAYDLIMNGKITLEGIETERWSDDEYDYTKTIYYESVVDCHFDFNKILWDASSKISDNLTNALEPFNLDNLKEYNHSYLSGFLAENYDVSINDCFAKAKDRGITTAISYAGCATMHGMCSCKKNEMNIVNPKNYYILLPVWMVNIDYKDKRYFFALNGDTGKLVGDYPVSIPKVILYSVLIFIALFVAIMGLVIVIFLIIGGLS